MPLPSTRAGRARLGRRRMVRIAKPRGVTRTAALSLLIVVLPVLLIYMAWLFWQQEEEVQVLASTPRTRVLDWRCERRHGFEDRGQVEPRVCPTCGKPAYPVEMYYCPRHGPVEVAVRFTTDANNIARPSQFRIGARKWVAAERGLHCLRCDQELIRTPEDPFKRSTRSKKRIRKSPRPD